MDRELGYHIRYRNLTGYTAIITDAGQSVTHPLTKYLISLNCKVVLACEFMDICDNIVKDMQISFPNKAILIKSYYMNISDLETIYNFTSQFNKEYLSADFLINVAEKGDMSSTAEGLNPHVGSQYLGHYALSKWVLPKLLKPIEHHSFHNKSASKIVNIVSADSITAKLPSSLLDGNGIVQHSKNESVSCYEIEKLLYLYYSHELQHRIDNYISNNLQQSRFRYWKTSYRRLVASAVDIGKVAKVTDNLFWKWFARKPEEAAMVILHALLDNNYIPGSFINSMKNNFDLFDYESRYLGVHAALFPNISLEYLSSSTNNPTNRPAFSFVNLIWSNSELISPLSDEHKVMSRTALLDFISSSLYNQADDFINNWIKETKNS
jgi:hypothetical protein